MFSALRSASRSPRLCLAAIVVLGALLRLSALTTLPPGLYQDEAVEGLDALRILNGEFPLYFETNNGREPAFMYALAAGILLLGRTPVALRAVAAVAGILAIPATFLAVKSLFGTKTALISAFVFATTLWTVQLSRLGLRSALLPLALALAVWSLARAWRLDRAAAWLLAGGLSALSLYVYLPARLLPAVPAALALLEWLAGGNRRRLARGAAWYGLAYALVALPLALYALGHWGIFSGRAGQVSILNPDINQGRLLQTFAAQIVRVGGMFLFAGDKNLRHNVPARPIFDWLMGLAFVAGLAVSLPRWRERRIQALWVWLAVFLLPTVLSDSAPHFLRGYGVWPLLAIFPALGLMAIVAALRRWAGALPALLLPAAILGVSVLATVRAYFWSGYLTSQAAYDAFDTFVTDMVAEVNAFTGLGWQGAVADGPSPAGLVWIDPRLYAFTEAVEFLVPQTPAQPDSRVRLLDPNALHPLPVEPYVRLIVIPGEEQPYLALLPNSSLITLRDGALARAQPDDPPFLLYRSITAEPAGNLPPPIACFGDALQLLPPQVSSSAGHLAVELPWRLSNGSSPDLTVFLHALEDGQVIAQSDSFPANGLFPFSWLRPGDVIRDTRVLPIDPAALASQSVELSAGVYDATTGQRLPATDCAGSSLGDHVLLEP